MRDVNAKELVKYYDRIVLTSVKFSVLAVAAGVFAVLFFDSGGLWLANIVLVGMAACLIAMTWRWAKTGKRYAAGAKKRRKKILPFMYPTKSEQQMN